MRGQRFLDGDIICHRAQQRAAYGLRESRRGGQQNTTGPTPSNMNRHEFIPLMPVRRRSTFHQKATRSPNWTWRGPDEVVARPNGALVISLDTPVRFTRLKVLKSSPVTSNFVVSPSRGRSNAL